ncbi:MAG: retropepsin-like domain-containing protein [Bacteroidetes bacterium]|nr:retropepsin-like domain-containing protein [Bacteroidota bacterium]
MKTQNISIDPNWINKNKDIVGNYAGKWIAINPEKGIIGYSDSRKELSEKCEDIDIPYIFYHVPLYSGIVRFIPIYFKSVVTHNWRPVYPVQLRNNKNTINDFFLIDSGADSSLISKEAGKQLGFIRQTDDAVLTALGIGGTVEYILKTVDCTIDEHTLKIPVAWIQTDGIEDLLIGRDVVFDYFDIEFKQKTEKIIFKPVK